MGQSAERLGQGATGNGHSVKDQSSITSDIKIFDIWGETLVAAAMFPTFISWRYAPCSLLSAIEREFY